MPWHYCRPPVVTQPNKGDVSYMSVKSSELPGVYLLSPSPVEERKLSRPSAVMRLGCFYFMNIVVCTEINRIRRSFEFVMNL